jgi:general secretion pathway protein A
VYATFYGFTLMPFGVTPDTRFFFPSSRHSEALASLIYAVTERKGFALITGEIGSGKTTVARALLSNLPPDTRVAMVLNTHLTSKQLLEVICQEFELSVRGRDRVEMHAAINDYLIQQLAQDRNVVLLIDEAQNLNSRTLEEIRMISNLETETEKLVQVILMGQPELKRKIEAPDLEQLRQRITVRFHIAGLSHEETEAYIRHRLRIAGNERGVQFTRGALREVVRGSRGIPRLVNIICDNALLLGFVRQTKKMTEDLVREVTLEMSGDGSAESTLRPPGRLGRAMHLARTMFWRPFRVLMRA